VAETFTVRLPNNWRNRWAEMLQGAKKYNFKVTRRGNNISFNGYGIEASISISGNLAEVTIDKKPALLSKDYIVKLVSEFLLKNG